MPIYEYRCRACGKKFEQVVFGSDKEQVRCPSCGSEEAARLMSAFASCGSGKESRSSCAPSSGHS